MTGLIASIVEAYGELRVNKGRVLLSLIGIAFSVFALTVVLSGGDMLNQAIQQASERQGGRPAIIEVSANGGGTLTGAEADAAADAAVLEQFDQLGITQRSRSVQASVGVQTGAGVLGVDWRGVDPGWGPMHRVDVLEGRWLADSDAHRLAPAIVIDESLYDKLGRPGMGTGTVDIVGPDGKTVPAVIIGVVPASDPSGNYPLVFMSIEAVDQLPAGTIAGGIRTYLAWVPPEQAQDVQDALTSRLSSTRAGSFSAYRSDFFQGPDPFVYFQMAVTGVAVVILLLGALGLVNIALVTIRYRVREIGIRRSYGATGLRVFMGVLMESVVASVIAGLVGVTAAVALVNAPFVQDLFRYVGLVDFPPFPMRGVVIGLLAATVVGILAGALPAIIATRIKVIDAIRG
ncbi:ABC transporter permease [Brachybacterium huguangmaarense]